MRNERGERWSFLRKVLAQGAMIGLEYKDRGYEAYSARLDAAARERADEWQGREGADWRERSWAVHSFICGERIHTDRDVQFCTLALAGEVGELANLIKKQWRQEWGWPVDDPERLAREIADEIADAHVYLWLLAKTLKLDLDAITLSKWERVEKRFGPEVQAILAALSIPLADATAEAGRAT